MTRRYLVYAGGDSIEGHDTIEDSNGDVYNIMTFEDVQDYLYNVDDNIRVFKFEEDEEDDDRIGEKVKLSVFEE